MGKKLRPSPLFIHHVSPRLEEVNGYFIQHGAPHREAQDFYHVYENRHWTNTRGHFIKNWKIVAARWIASILTIPSACLPDTRS